MISQALARKWRPQSFQEMVGQSHVLKALINALDNGRLHHAYLFTGTRGVGKTTLARLMAKCLNCEEAVSSNPCGNCSACISITEGRFVDLIEVDAASRTKVEDTRELLDNVQYAPSVGRYKIYLIDEVHMLSTHSFNALLKTLEEPPEHVKFLLATTDPQKLPVTILSRCLQFALKPLSVPMIVKQLSKILCDENITFEEQALHRLAESADGSMRDALSLTDQAIAYCNDQLTDEPVREMLGALDTTKLYPIIEALHLNSAKDLLKAIKNLGQDQPQWAAVIDQLLLIWYRLALRQCFGQQAHDEISPLFDQQLESRLSTILTPEEVQYYYQMALMGKRDFTLASDPQSGFEMLMMRMMSFRPQKEEVLDPKDINPHTQPSNNVTDSKIDQKSHLSVQEVYTPQSDAIVSETKCESMLQMTQQDANLNSENSKIGTTCTQMQSISSPVESKINLDLHSDDHSERDVNSNSPDKVSDDTSTLIASMDASTMVLAQWPSLVDTLNLSGPALELARISELVGMDAQSWRLKVPMEHQSLLMVSIKSRLQSAVCELLNLERLSLIFEVVNAPVDSPRTQKIQRQALEMEAEELTLLQEPLLKQVLHTFDAHIMPGSLELKQLQFLGDET